MELTKKQRNSNLELFRIFMMIAIIAHHLVVNSGVDECFNFQNITSNMIFLQLFGFAGKAMINGFVLITGYFMIKQKFSFNKVVKLYLEIKFYKIIIYFIFVALSYESFALKSFVKSVFNIAYSANGGFIATFFFLYLLSPFINKALNAISQKSYLILLAILITYFTVFSTFFLHEVFSELGWYITMYAIGGYIRTYPIKLLENTKATGALTILSLLLCFASILCIDFVNYKLNRTFPPYFMFVDAQKILALVLAVFSFCFFKNIKIKNSKIINTISLTTLDVLLIHANGDTMRRFLWQDLLNIKGHYTDSCLPFYAIGSVLAIYIVCVLIGLARIYLLEKPVLKKLNNHDKFNNLCTKIENIVN